MLEVTRSSNNVGIFFISLELVAFLQARKALIWRQHTERLGVNAVKWTDTLDIAIELDEKFPDIDPMHINFVDLRNWVCQLDDFDDEPNHSGERILEAIQMAWIEEKS